MKTPDKDRGKSMVALEKIFLMSLDLICIADIQTAVFLKVNPAFRHTLGFSENQLLGRPFFEFIHPDDIESTKQVVENQLLKGEPVLHFENRYACRNGDYRWLSWVSHPDIEKGVTYAIARDVTEQKLAKKKLQASELRYRLLFEQSPLGIFHFDNKGVIVDCNDNFVAIIGSSKEKLIGLNMLKLPDKKLVFELQKSLNGETGYYEDIYHSVTADKATPVKVFAAPLLDRDSKSFGCVGIVEDITEQKKAQEEKEKLQAQLIQAHKMESVGRLAGGVAHDFNNMLTVILGYTQAAMGQTEPSSRLHQNLKQVFNAARRSADLTKQLLTFARKQIINPVVLDLNRTVTQMITMLQRLIGEDMNLAWKPAENLWPVKMDPSQVDQILANLCVNARDAIDSVGRITIETGMKDFTPEECADFPDIVPGEFVLLKVSDTGCGMDKETLDNLFEPFFTTKDQGEGTGLGLATIYGIVKQNSGFIHVDSEPGRGTAFEIYLPRFMEEEDIPGKKQVESPPKGGDETILLVEDDPAILEMIQIMLEDLGYHVLAAPFPGRALEIARDQGRDIHLLLTDVVMPEMNGRSLARQLETLYPEMKCLFMSGYTADVIANQGILDEGVLFMQKPFYIRDLADNVRKALDGKTKLSGNQAINRGGTIYGKK